MARVLLTTYEIDNDLLPAVCARCGAPAADRVVLTTRIFDGWSGALRVLVAMVGLFFFPPLLMVAVRGARATHVRVPLCESHRDAFRRAERAESRVVIPVWTFVSLVVDGLLIAVLASGGPPGVCYAPFSVLIVAIAAGAYVGWGQVRITRADKAGVRLSGVHAAFAVALAEDRARDRVSNPDRRGGHGDTRDDYDDEAS